jgi:hypothetical protein
MFLSLVFVFHDLDLDLSMFLSWLVHVLWKYICFGYFMPMATFINVEIGKEAWCYSSTFVVGNHVSHVFDK